MLYHTLSTTHQTVTKIPEKEQTEQYNYTQLLNPQVLEKDKSFYSHLRALVDMIVHHLTQLPTAILITNISKNFKFWSEPIYLRHPTIRHAQGTKHNCQNKDRTLTNTTSQLGLGKKTNRKPKPEPN